MPHDKSKFHSLIYFPIVLGVSWGTWFLAIATGQGIEVLTGKIMLLVGLFGPAIAALILMYLGKDGEAHWDYWRRLVDTTPITRGKLWGILLLPPVLSLVAVLASLVFGSSAEQLRINPQLRTHFLAVLSILLYTFFIGPVPEEMGWRGYWLDRLKKRAGAFKASLIIGAAWAIWQVPLLFIKGYEAYAFRGDWMMLVVFFGSLIPKSIIITFIYYRTNRSTLAAVLFHFMMNFTATVFEIDHRSELFQFGFYILVAAVLIVVGKEIFFGRRKAERSAA